MSAATRSPFARPLEEAAPDYLAEQEHGSAEQALLEKLAGKPAPRAPKPAPVPPKRAEPAPAPRSARVSTYVTEEERFELRARAAQGRMTVEAYIHGVLFPTTR